MKFVDFPRVEDFPTIFVDPRSGEITNLSKVRLLRCAVDTVRQHYKGMLRPELMVLFGDKPGMVDFAGYRFHASRVGRDSGYQYKLQNSDLGLILLIKNFNVPVDAIGSHLKIEVSPHAIADRTPQRLQDQMDHLAAASLTHCEQSQCAVHIALDFQGWTPPSDFADRMHCRATKRRGFGGISEIQWADKAAVYGRGQSFLFGSAGACQFALYNKTEQAKAIDKLDWCEREWRKRDSFDLDDPLNYNPDQPVWRAELRYHHSVVQQFAEGSWQNGSITAIETSSYAALAPHLDGLWRYGFKNFKLTVRQGVIDPLWTMIREDVRVETGVDSLLDETDYKRHYKTAKGFSGRNVDLAIGNLISLLAREGTCAKKAFAAVKELPVWPVIRDHYKARDMLPSDIFKMIRDRLEERVIRWGRAV